MLNISTVTPLIERIGWPKNVPYWPLYTEIDNSTEFTVDVSFYTFARILRDGKWYVVPVSLRYDYNAKAMEAIGDVNPRDFIRRFIMNVHEITIAYTTNGLVDHYGQPMEYLDPNQVSEVDRIAMVNGANRVI